MPTSVPCLTRSRSGVSASRKSITTRCLALLLAAFLAWPIHGFSQLFISEFLADNQVNTLVDEDGDHSDWIEIWNSGTSPVSLNGWYLTDDSGDLRKWRFPVTTPSVTVAGGGRLVVFASNKDRKLLANRLHTNFRLSKSAGGFLALVRADGLTIEHQYVSYPQQIQDIAYGLPTQTAFQPLVPESANGKAKVPLSSADMTAGWNGNGVFDDSSWQSGATGFGYDTAGTYGALIGAGGDLQAAMHTVNSTALIRIPFTVSNLSSILSLRLSMKYDDGYICYLNGVQIAGANAPAPPQWNSGSTIDRNGALTATYEVVNPSNAHTLLVNGTNMLAIQMLNFSNGSTQDVDNQGTPNGSRTLCLPLLEANVNVGVGEATYLQTATPNSANSVPRTSIGPLISATTNSVIRPAGGASSAPIVISTTVVPSLRPLATTNPVMLRYRIAYGTEQLVAMRDDGIAPDLVAGDSTYVGQIPTTALAPGQMLRWRVSASDSNSTPSISTDPPYLDTTDNDQYYGTVALDSPSQGLENSNLPVMYWFVENAGASRTEGGTRCSIYYLGKFYDNVFVNLHGQSSSGFPTNKKSHDFNFNEDNRFTWKLGEPAQRAINLLTNYADKAKVRNTLAWESWATASHVASHYSFPVRVQQNGTFWGVYDMVENGDEDFLERSGLDVNGAFYKVYNSLENSTGVEKKTRKFESNGDLQALVTALDTGTQSLTNRRRYSYDNVDVPTLVNYMANNQVVLNNDFGHKNYYIYRDTNGTREWSVLPWDQDLSLGHTWTSSQNYFNDDIHTQKSTSSASELVLGAAGGNRLMNLVTNTSSATVAPEMVQMFLRRLRTLMDKNLISATETNGPWEQRINQLVDLIDPPGATFLTDGDRDLQQWGYWTDGNGNPVSAVGQDAAVHDYGIRKQALRILNANPSPPYPASATNAEGLNNTIPAYLPGRRNRLFNGSLTLLGFPIPPSQAAQPTGLTIESVEFNPGNQSQEYFIIRNNSTSYIDISDWKITGAVEYTFRGGTVIPPFTSGQPITATGDVHIGRLHVVRDSFGFRSRTASPKGNEYRLVVGGYKGQLSARGETINLVKPGATPAEDVVIATTTYAGSPTATQNFLRVTELNFNPAGPTAAELAALPGVEASDFEFIELINADAAPLNLGGATFDNGIAFTFPANFTLQPGERCVVAALIPAYNLRHGNSGAIVAGQFEGNLSNSGETLQLLDASGEQILEFNYDPDWYGIPDSTAFDGVSAVQGYSLVTRTSAPVWNSYENPVTWALGGTAEGTPGTGDTTFKSVFRGWAQDYFTPLEQSGGLSVPEGDTDSDTRTNFFEYVFGGDPRNADAGTVLARTMVTDAGVNYPAVRFPVRAGTLDVALLVEASNDGATWRPLGASLTSRTSLNASFDEVTVRDSEPAIAGSRTFRVRAQYVGSTYETAPITIVNQAPTAVADTGATHNTAVTIAVITNDTDADTDALAVRSVGGATHGSVVLNGDGTATFTPDGTFGASGGSFTYVVGDNFGGEAQGLVTINVLNQMPTALADNATAHAATVTINVLSNDTDPDSDALSVSSVTQGQHGTATANGPNVTYSPSPSFLGAGSDTFTYTAADGYGGTSIGTVTVTLTNTSPVATADSFSVRLGAFAVPVLTNDTDAEADTLVVTGVTQGTQGTVALDNGIVTYTASGTFTGSDTFSYTVSDGYGGTANGTVTISNTAPQAVNDIQRVSNGAGALIPVVSNDVDPDDGQVLTPSIATAPTAGTAAVEGTSIRYTPGASFASTGKDTFTYSVSDGFGGTATAEVRVVDELLAAVPGTYVGLVGGETEDKVGIATIQLTTKGRFTGQVWYLGEKHAVKKKVFDATGAVTFTIVTKTGKSRQLTLQLDSMEDGMTGELIDGATADYAVTLKRAPKVFSKANPCPHEGSYTVLLPAAPGTVGDLAYPQGTGSATMKIAKNGRLTATAVLGDGQRAVFKSSVLGDNTALLHAPLYKNPKGFICGPIGLVTGDAAADWRGDLTWWKLAQSVPDTTSPLSFKTTAEWMAARFTKLAPGTLILGPGVTAANITLEYGGLLVSPVQKTATITAKGIQVQAQGTDVLTITVNRGTGAFTGKYTHPRDLKKRPVSGVLYQKQTVGRGMFNGINESGQVVTGSWMLAP